MRWCQIILDSEYEIIMDQDYVQFEHRCTVQVNPEVKYFIVSHVQNIIYRIKSVFHVNLLDVYIDSFCQWVINVITKDGYYK